MSTVKDNLAKSLTDAIEELTDEIADLTAHRTNLQTALEGLKDVEDAPKGPRRNRVAKDPVKPKSTRSVKKAESNGGEAKQTRAEQIEDLLRQNYSPAEVAEELGINKTYVYHVRRSAIEQGRRLARFGDDETAIRSSIHAGRSMKASK